MSRQKSLTQFERRRTADGVDTLYSSQYDQTYHSTFGALVEAEQVFLSGAGVKERLAAQKPTRVLEIGFGTGLNFFLTAHHSRHNQTRLHYVALEQHLLPVEWLARLNHSLQLPEAANLRRMFIAWRSGLPHPCPPGSYHWPADETLRLDLVIGDATQVAIPNHAYHAIYLDAFSPDANPELWTVDFFARLVEVLAPGGRLATYSVKGAVRRGLQGVGFQVQKVPGPPGKREILIATRA